MSASRLTVIEKIPARKCSVVELSLQEASEFVAQHHRQGMPRVGKNPVALGLIYQHRIVGAAIFCNPRTSGMQDKYQRELLRLAFPQQVRVQGGASLLIKSFLRREPWDLFTYQDTSGEDTSVYEQCGMTLRGPRYPQKEILVRDGCTAATAQNNRQDWFSMEQVVRLGPDALLGTSLGEVYREDGSRKSNVDLFLEHCGYHRETVPGDRIYEWRNPQVSFYLYKITSTADPGRYYIGRHVYRGKREERDLLEDGYWGSGGKKFQEWKENQPLGALRKEILATVRTWEEASQLEKKLIGSAHRDDPLCLNSMPGGPGKAPFFPTPTLRECPEHGEVLHRGNSCMTCSSRSVFQVALCPLHGETTHQKGKCFKCLMRDNTVLEECPTHGLVAHTLRGTCITCTNSRTTTLRECTTHGLSKHQGDTCSKCVKQAQKSRQECPTHGLTNFFHGTCVACQWEARREQGSCPEHGEVMLTDGRCRRCLAEQSFHRGSCPVHGETTFRKDACLRCNIEESKLYHEGECSKHGKATYRGDKCLLCIAEKSSSYRECPTHGLTLHRGDACSTCTAQRGVHQGVCEVHGETTFMGQQCRQCINQRSVSLRECPTHGRSKHQGDTCCKCSSAQARRGELRECPTHGLAPHSRAGKCRRCAASSTMGECPTHGEVKMTPRGKCTKCEAARQQVEGECPTHGLTRFKGKSCCRCTAEKTAHTRHSRRGEVRSECRFCEDVL